MLPRALAQGRATSVRGTRWCRSSTSPASGCSTPAARCSWEAVNTAARTSAARARATRHARLRRAPLSLAQVPHVLRDVRRDVPRVHDHAHRDQRARHLQRPLECDEEPARRRGRRQGVHLWERQAEAEGRARAPRDHARRPARHHPRLVAPHHRGARDAVPAALCPREDRHALAALAALSSAAAAAADAPPDGLRRAVDAAADGSDHAADVDGAVVARRPRLRHRARAAACPRRRRAARPRPPPPTTATAAPTPPVRGVPRRGRAARGVAAARPRRHPLVAAAAHLADAPARRSSGLDSPPPTFPTLESRWVRADGGDGGAFVLNSRAAEPFETDLFEGKLLVMLRPSDSAADDPHYHRRLFSQSSNGGARCSCRGGSSARRGRCTLAARSTPPP